MSATEQRDELALRPVVMVRLGASFWTIFPSA
jgi:hypothetical protein